MRAPEREARRQQAGDVEAQRQQALLRAIGIGDAAAAATVEGLREQGARALRGLEAYRANAGAIAERALAAALPTVAAMIGADEFGRVARAYWRAHPPTRGDLGEWGDDYADWLQAQPSLTAWPYLADGARLDLALHRCERAADAALDAASLALLESADPAVLRLVTMPGTALLCSAWPIATIHAAHQLGEGAAADAAYADVRAALDAQRGECALVARRGWRGVVHRIDDDADRRFTRAVFERRSLAQALEAGGAAFDFAGWLQRAIQQGWLQGLERMSR